MTDFEKSRLGRPRWGWAIVIAICAAALVWGYVNYSFIHDRPRQWDFGQVPDAPGESIYSSSQPSTLPARQLPPLPHVSATQEAK